MAFHSLLTDPEIHEAKGTAAANVNEVFVADGAGSGAFALIPEQLPTGTAAANAGEIFIADGAAGGAFADPAETDPTGTSAATVGQVFIADGAGSGAFGPPSLNPQVEHIAVQNANFGGGGTAPTASIVGNYNGWLFTINDDSVFTIELPLHLDPAEDIEVHLQWAINEAFATASGEVQWQVEWSLIPFDSTEPINAPTHTGTLTTGDINIPTTANHLTSTELVIPAANVASGDTLGVTLTRIALVGGVDPTAEPLVISAHVQYTTNGT